MSETSVVNDDDDGIWLGRLSMDDVLHLCSHTSSSSSSIRNQPEFRDNNNDLHKDNKSVVVVGFVYFWSSWCHRRLQGAEFCSEKEIRSGLDELVRQLRETNQQPFVNWNSLTWKSNDVHIVSGHVQVDETDDSLDQYIGDNQLPTQERRQLFVPCPPEELPVLAVVIQSNTTTTGYAFLHYLTSFRSRWFERGNLNERVIMTGDWITPVVNELGRLPLELAAYSAKISQSSDNNNNDEAIRIFVAGDKSSVGKSSICLGILGCLVQNMGYAPSTLAYIKPATQCEAPQLVQAYCDRMGIECVPVGPIVYYKGFTRAFLAGETESSAELLAKACHAVDRIAQGKQIVLVDGVGFPAVGSICGTDNAAVARACGYTTNEIDNNNNNDAGSSQRRRRRPMAVLLVGGSGVGAAVDAFNLNATYFEQHHVPVIGAIFNKLELEGFYSLENCRAQVTAYFSQSEHQRNLGRQPFGFVPSYPGLSTASALDQVDEWIDLFRQHVNVKGIVEAARRVKEEQLQGEIVDVTEDIRTSIQPAKKVKLSSTTPFHPDSMIRALTREEIEQRAIGAGAAPSA